MTEEAQVKEETTVSQPDNKAKQESQSKPSIDAQKPPEESQEQINWRKFRQEREKERKAKEESDRRATEKEAEANALKLAMEALLNKPQPQQSYSEDTEESEDDRINKKVQKALEAERARNDTERRKQETAELPRKLQSTFSDFNQVCTQENLDYLEFHYPEVAAGFKHAPDTFESWANVYKVMKRFIPNTDSKREQAKIEKNLSKPQSMSVPGSTQTGDHAPTQLTEQRRADNWKRMQSVIRGAK